MLLSVPNYPVQIGGGGVGVNETDPPTNKLQIVLLLRLRQTYVVKIGLKPKLPNKVKFLKREPWSSGFGRRLMFERLWV